MSNEPKISIIIPFFNSEKYLARCLDSVAGQKYSNLEIILIDDGSTDSSLNIAHSYKDKDTRFKVFSKEHRGVSEARNLGIKKATGAWLTFVDSDDTVKSNFCATISSVTEENPDIIINCVTSFTDGSKSEVLSPAIANSITLHTAQDKIILCKSIFNNFTKKIIYPHTACCHAKFFRKDLITKNHISFNKKLKLYEDAYFIMQAIAKSHQIVFCNQTIYNYIINSDSVTKKYLPKETLSNYSQSYTCIFHDKAIKTLYDKDDAFYMKTKDLNQILKNYTSQKSCTYKSFKLILLSKIFAESLQNVKINNIPKLNRLMVILTRMHLYRVIYLMYKTNNIIKSRNKRED